MKNSESKAGMGKPRGRYREEMKKAAKDSRFVRDIEDTTHDFVAVDKEVFDMLEEGLPQQAGKPSSNETISSFRRQRNNDCEKKVRPCGRGPLNPPLKAIQTTIQKAIAKMHAAGVSTAHCDEKGRAYLRHPDGGKEFCEVVINASEADADD